MNDNKQMQRKQKKCGGKYRDRKKSERKAEWINNAKKTYDKDSKKALIQKYTQGNTQKSTKVENSWP